MNISPARQTSTSPLRQGGSHGRARPESQAPAHEPEFLFGCRGNGDLGACLTQEYAAASSRDFVAFVHRAFCDSNPQTRSLPASHIELIASQLEDCRSVVNLPPRSLKSHSVSIAFVASRRRLRDSGRSAFAYAPQVGCSFAGRCPNGPRGVSPRRASVAPRRGWASASHDLAIVEHLTRRVAVMYLGKIVERSLTVVIYFADPPSLPARCFPPFPRLIWALDDGARPVRITPPKASLR